MNDTPAPKPAELSLTTIERLLKVKAMILAKPKLFNMNRDGCPEEKCGAPGCLFGWAVVLFADAYQQRMHPTSVYMLGAEVLGLPKPAHSESWMDAYETERAPGEAFAARLFYVGNWPTKFKKRYHREVEEAADADRTGETEAKLTAERIDHFIATNGAE